MNILMLTPDFYPVWGGTGTYVINLIKNFPKDYSVHLITLKRKNFNDQLITSDLRENLPDNVTTHYIGNANDTFFYNLNFQLNYRRCFKSLLKSCDIDLIHSQSSMPDLFVSPKMEMPVVTTVHTTIESQIKAIKSIENNFTQLDFSEKMTRLLGPFLKTLENKYYNNNRNYIAVSKWSKENLLKEKGMSRNLVKVIYNGVDNNDFRFSKIKAKTTFPELYDEDRPIILYLSRLIKSKGINYLIETIPKILNKVDAHFVIAGAGNTPKMKAQNDDVTFLGYVNHEITPLLYGISDIYILPSVYENLPFGILEAMASKSAVIATAIGGIPEIINNKENGILIPPRDHNAIENSILNILNNDNFKNKLINNAKKTIENKFNAKITAKNTISLYENLIG